MPPGARARIESVRLRSLPISGTPVASGSDYKAMRKVRPTRSIVALCILLSRCHLRVCATVGASQACAIAGKIDTSAPINAYVVFNDSTDAEAVLYLNGEVCCCFESESSLLFRVVSFSCTFTIIVRLPLLCCGRCCLAGIFVWILQVDQKPQKIPVCQYSLVTFPSQHLRSKCVCLIRPTHWVS